MAIHYQEAQIPLAFGTPRCLHSMAQPLIRLKVVYEVARIALVLHIFAITINRNALWEVKCNKLIFLSKCMLLAL